MFSLMECLKIVGAGLRCDISPLSLNICNANKTVQTSWGTHPSSTFTLTLHNTTVNIHTYIHFIRNTSLHFCFHSHFTKNIQSSHASLTHFRNLLSYMNFTWSSTLFHIFPKYAATASGQTGVNWVSLLISFTYHNMVLLFPTLSKCLSNELLITQIMISD